MPKLVAMLKDASSAIRKSAAAALATLVDGNSILISFSLSISPFSIYLIISYVLYLSLSTLFIFSFFDCRVGYNKKIVKNLDGIKILLDLLKDNQIPPKYSLLLLASLAHESSTFHLLRLLFYHHTASVISSFVFLTFVAEKIKNQVPKLFPTVFRKIVLLLSPYTKPTILSAAIAALMELARNNGKTLPLLTRTYMFRSSIHIFHTLPLEGQFKIYSYYSFQSRIKKRSSRPAPPTIWSLSSSPRTGTTTTR